MWDCSGNLKFVMKSVKSHKNHKRREKFSHSLSLTFITNNYTFQISIRWMLSMINFDPFSFNICHLHVEYDVCPGCWILFKCSLFHHSYPSGKRKPESFSFPFENAFNYFWERLTLTLQTLMSLFLCNYKVWGYFSDIINDLYKRTKNNFPMVNLNNTCEDGMKSKVISTLQLIWFNTSSFPSTTWRRIQFRIRKICCSLHSIIVNWEGEQENAEIIYDPLEKYLKFW